MVKYSVIIPCYNEYENLPLFLVSFHQYAAKRNDIELLVVNNGSTDKTASLQQYFVHEYPYLKWLHIPANIGYGNGIKQGIANASGQFIGYTHADMQTHPADVFKAIEKLNSLPDGNYLIKGQRIKRKRFAKLFSICLEVLASAILGTKMREINAQPNLFDAKLVPCFDAAPDHWGFDLFVYFTALRNGYSVERFDVEFLDRKAGESKWAIGVFPRIRLSVKMIRYTLKLQKQSVKS